MITINGKHFAENEQEFTNSLFNKIGTCVGYAKRFKRRIKLYNIQKNIIGGLNKWGVLHATDKNGFHSFMTIKEIGEIESYREQCDLGSVLSIGHDYVKYETAYIYK